MFLQSKDGVKRRSTRFLAYRPRKCLPRTVAKRHSMVCRVQRAHLGRSFEYPQLLPRWESRAQQSVVMQRSSS